MPAAGIAAGLTAAAANSAAAVGVAGGAAQLLRQQQANVGLTSGYGAGALSGYGVGVGSIGMPGAAGGLDLSAGGNDALAANLSSAMQSLRLAGSGGAARK